MKQSMTIGELANIAGISTRTIRHYEEVGLFHYAYMNESGYRIYGQVEMEHLEKILLLKQLDFTLGEIKQILETTENDEIAQLFQNKLQTLEETFKEIKRQKEMLLAVSAIYKNHGVKYLNNYHLMKEIIGMNNVFIRKFNGLSLALQLQIIKELYYTGTLSQESIKSLGAKDSKLLLHELRMSLVKSLLNKVDREVEKDIILTLLEEDHALAKHIQKAMFTFEDFARLDNHILSVWLEACDEMDLLIALKEQTGYVKNRILGAMEELYRTQFLKQLDQFSVPNLEEAYEAMDRLIEVLRRLEIEGKIVIERFN